MNDVWFQQVVATCYTSLVTIDLLHQIFDNRLNNRNGAGNSPRSRDLTSLENCYVGKQETFKQLWANIRDANAKL